MNLKKYFCFKNKLFLFLPIEIHSREFHSKLYLANYACQHGWNVLIGPEYEINNLALCFPRGVYIGIGFHNKASKICKIMKNYGHIVLSQDEEGLVRLTPKYYNEYRVNKQINKYSDHVLCWGDNHKKIMQSWI